MLLSPGKRWQLHTFWERLLVSSHKIPDIQKRHPRVLKVDSSCLVVPTIKNTSVVCMGTFAFQASGLIQLCITWWLQMHFWGKKETGSGFRGMFLPNFSQQSSCGAIDKGIEGRNIVYTVIVPFTSAQRHSQRWEGVWLPIIENLVSNTLIISWKTG